MTATENETNSIIRHDKGQSTSLENKTGQVTE